MTVVDLVVLTRRSWRTLLISIMLGLVVAIGYSAVQPPVYESRSTGFVVAGGDAGFADAVSGSQAAISKANSYIPLITSKAVFATIADDPELGIDPAALDGRLSAKVLAGSTLIEVTATASTPQGAVALANGALDALAVVIDDIETRVSSSQAAAVSVVPLENAVPPMQPSSPSWTANLLVGALAGLVLGYSFVFLRRALDVRVRSSDDLAESIGVGVLGRIPKLPRSKRATRAITDLDMISAEAFRQLRTGLRFASVDTEVRSIIVTSANQSEGKSTIAATLATVLAQAGQPTILVDADLRRPSVTEVLGIDGQIGLSEVLSGQVRLADAVRTTNTPGLVALPSGRTPPNPSEMLGSEAMRSLIARLSQDAFVVVDAPPLLPVTDAALVSVIVDGVVYVAAAGRTRKPDIVASRRILEQVRARVLGTVLNLVPARDGDGGYYRYYRKNRTYYTAATATERPVVADAGSGSGARRRAAEHRSDA